MHILLLSRVMKEEDFSLLIEKGNSANPSNQHFYHSFAKMCALQYPVDILSYRPFTIQKCHHIQKEENQEGNIIYHYLPYYNIPKIKGFCIQNYRLGKIKKYIHSDTLIVVDSLQIPLVKLAFKIAKKYHLPIMGVITDHPKNITGVSSSYQKKVLHYFPLYDFYYCLTPALEKEANRYHRPSFIKEGLIDVLKARQQKERLYDHYLFFGGALYTRYGIMNLLEAFHRFPSSYHLIIAGHGKDASIVKQYTLEDNRIDYVGLLNKKEITDYEENALVNINPRPLDANIDEYSFPSKVLEYIANGTPLLTTKNKRIVDLFGDDLFYIGNGEEHEIYNGFVDFFDTPQKVREKKAISARKKALKLFSIYVVSQELDAFLRLHSSPSNFLDSFDKEKYSSK